MISRIAPTLYVHSVPRNMQARSHQMRKCPQRGGGDVERETTIINGASYLPELNNTSIHSPY